MARSMLWACLLLAAGCAARKMDPAFQGGTNKEFVYIVGETQGGDIRLEYKQGLTVLDLVSQRGGITTRGTAEKIHVYRPSEGKTLSCNLDYNKIEKGDARQNIILQGGDIVYVPKTVTTALYDGFKAIFPPWEDMMGKGAQWAEMYAASKAAK
ncbi:MAG: hypothetical protein AB1696_00385 [Planctomycetota bacterium]